MNILRLSTLSLTIILFSLGALMLPVNTTLAHHCKGDHRGAPGCPGDTGAGDTDSATYSVIISGDVSGVSTVNWIGGFVGKRSIGLNDSGSQVGPVGVGTLTDLGFFTSDQGPFGTLGAICFPFNSFPIHQAIIKRGRGGRADIAIWFHGRTKAGGGPIPYLLQLFGQFDPSPDIDRLPVDETTNVITATDWVLGAKNEDNSCRGEGDNDIIVYITVEVT